MAGGTISKGPGHRCNVRRSPAYRGSRIQLCRGQSRTIRDINRVAPRKSRNELAIQSQSKDVDIAVRGERDRCHCLRRVQPGQGVEVDATGDSLRAVLVSIGSSDYGFGSRWTRCAAPIAEVGGRSLGTSVAIGDLHALAGLISVCCRTEEASLVTPCSGHQDSLAARDDVVERAGSWVGPGEGEAAGGDRSAWRNPSGGKGVGGIIVVAVVAVEADVGARAAAISGRCQGIRRSRPSQSRCCRSNRPDYQCWGRLRSRCSRQSLQRRSHCRRYSPRSRR